MITALLLTAQLANPAAVPASITVRNGAREATIPVVSSPAGPALRAELLTQSLGGTVRALAGGEYVIAVGGAELTLTSQLPFARSGAEVIPLANAPFVQGTSLYVPLQLVAEVLPRVATGLIFDAQRSEIRVFSATARGAIITGSGGADPPRGDPDLGRRSAPASQRADGARRRRLVVVDAGHGGPDNGMNGPIRGGPRIREKDITLAVARRVADALRERGVEVIMTRTTDTLIALSDRGRIANQNHGDLFLSIHVNAASPAWRDPGAARGFETYFLSEAKTEEARRVEQMENESVRFETGAYAPRGDPLSFIINDMAQNEHLRESAELADIVQVGLAKMHPGPDRGVKQANFAVLRTSFMPAVLIEVGFGTNAEEAAFLKDPSRQRQIAAAIAEATVEYLARYERKVAGGEQ